MTKVSTLIEWVWPNVRRIFLRGFKNLYCLEAK